MNGAYLFESAKCMALTLQLMQGSPVQDPTDEPDIGNNAVVNEYKSEAKYKQNLVDPKNAEAAISRDSLLDFYGKLTLLRKDALINGMLAHGEFKLAAPDHTQVFAYERSLDGKRFLIVSNWSKESLDFDLNPDFLDGDLRVSVYPEIILSNKMMLRPYEAFAILL